MFFGSIGALTQGLAHAREALLPLEPLCHPNIQEAERRGK
jgi:hypothetical protein